MAEPESVNILDEIDRKVDQLMSASAGKKPVSSPFSNPGGPGPNVMVDVDFQGPWRARQFGLDLDTYYRDRLRKFACDVDYAVWRWQNLPGICHKGTDGLPDHYFFNGAYISQPCEIYGIEMVIEDPAPPWHEKPLLAGPEDLGKLGMPDFRSSLQKDAMEAYETLNRVVGDRIQLVLNGFNSAPFDIACALRGQQEALLDIVFQPEFIKDLLDFAVESRLRWADEWQVTVGEDCPILPGLSNDCVDCNLISPDTYRDLIVPFDSMVAKHYPSVWWHSCGKTTPIQHVIRDSFPNLKRIDVSAWSELPNAVRVFDGREVLIRRMAHPIEDVLSDDDAHRLQFVQEIVEASEKFPIVVRIDGLQPIHELKHVLRLVNLLEKRLEAHYGRASVPAAS